MKLLVFGGSGQVGRALRRIAPDAVILTRKDADLTKPESCADAIHRLAPDVIINAAAWTAVDEAETNREIAKRINADAPAAMAEACDRIGAAFVHLSTDYVFDGAGDRPARPDDPAAPLSTYGETKYAGEVRVSAMSGPFAILRTSWVFSADGPNFVKTMIRLSKTTDCLRIVSDQVGGPTAAADIAQASLNIARTLIEKPETSGIYHYAGAPDIGRADFARTIFDRIGAYVIVEDVESAAFTTPARRPKNSRLDCSKTETVFGLQRPDWSAALDNVLRELTA